MIMRGDPIRNLIIEWMGLKDHKGGLNLEMSNRATSGKCYGLGVVNDMCVKVR